MKICDPSLQHTAYSVPHPKGRYDNWSCWPSHWKWSHCWIPTFLQGNKARHWVLMWGPTWAWTIGTWQSTACCSYKSVVVLNGTKKYTGAIFVCLFVYISWKWKSYSLACWFHTQYHTLLQKKGTEIPPLHNWSNEISVHVMIKWNAQYCI